MSAADNQKELVPAFIVLGHVPLHTTCGMYLLGHLWYVLGHVPVPRVVIQKNHNKKTLGDTTLKFSPVV